MIMVMVFFNQLLTAKSGRLTPTSTSQTAFLIYHKLQQNSRQSSYYAKMALSLF
jgi:hypothetical protein